MREPHLLGRVAFVVAAIIMFAALGLMLDHALQAMEQDILTLPLPMAAIYTVGIAAIINPALVLLTLHGLALLAWREVAPAIVERPRPLLYLMGCIGFSLGVKLFVDADLGVDPFHATTLGIVHVIDHELIGVGIVDAAVTMSLLAIWSLWNRRGPPLTTFATMLLVGLMIDVANAAELERWTLTMLPAPLLMVLGLILVAYGSALIIMSGVGIRVVDLLALSLVRHRRWRFYSGKLVVEALFLLGGMLSGGPIGIATIAFVLVVGPFVEPMIRVNRRLLGLPDYGLTPLMRSS